ncbi:MAG: pentapeptide repeat-containing protein, partial [Planctomycetes bacterium]|nr:pentapeptide repeat-containing protein [Planctomycetota bacterium]
DLSRANLGAAKLNGANLHGTNLSRADLNRADLTGADFGDADFAYAALNSVDLRGADLRLVSLSSADLSNANLSGAKLSKNDLRGVKLNNANLCNTDLTGANLLGAQMNVGTRFERASVRNCRIARHALECLDDYGGLSKGDRMLMIISDDVARLRYAYSGFLTWIHLTELCAFLVPSLWFVVKQWSIAKFGLGDDDTTISLWVALVRFIVSGGHRLDALVFHLEFGLFLYGLAYNLTRGIMLWKTKRLEMKELASGLPAMFTLTGWWGKLYTCARIGFWVNLFVVALHTYFFLQQRVKISELVG